MIARGEFGRMASLRGSDIVSVPIANAVSDPKRVTQSHPLVRTARSLGIIFGDEEQTRADIPSLAPG